jgi:hypothetical protein
MGLWERIKNWLGPAYAEAPEPPRQIPVLYRKPLPSDAPPYRPEGDDLPRSMPKLTPALDAGQWVEGHAIVRTSGVDSAHGFSRIGIHYEDAEGKYSERIISIAQLRAADGPYDHSMIVAFCHSANDIRHFRVDRIKGFFDPDTGEVLKKATLNADPSAFRLADNNAPNSLGMPHSLEGIEETFGRELEQMGWIVVRVKFELGERLACYRVAKRGSRRLKYPSVEIDFIEFEMEPVIGEGGQMVLQRGSRRKRPWCVRADSATTRTFGSIEHAAPAFLEAAKQEATKLSAWHKGS